MGIHPAWVWEQEGGTLKDADTAKNSCFFKVRKVLHHFKPIISQGTLSSFKPMMFVYDFLETASFLPSSIPISQEMSQAYLAWKLFWRWTGPSFLSPPGEPQSFLWRLCSWRLLLWQRWRLWVLLLRRCCLRPRVHQGWGLCFLENSRYLPWVTVNLSRLFPAASRRLIHHSEFDFKQRCIKVVPRRWTWSILTVLSSVYQCC